MPVATPLTPPAELYPSVNADKFWSAAHSSTIRYGGNFSPVIITGAKGHFMTAHDGKQILDFTSGQMSSLLGHGHPEIVATIAEHAAGLDHLFSGMLSPPVVNLTKKLTSLVSMHYLCTLGLICALLLTLAPTVRRCLPVSTRR